MERLRDERGSALVEAAVVLPCLLLIVLWSVALTDVLVLKLKAGEAARFALWETTVWKSPAQIEREVQERLADARSPASIRQAWTGLLAYPRASALRWHADVDALSTEVRLGGARIDMVAGSGIDGFVQRVSGWMARAVQGAMQAEQFNTHGAASVRVRLEASRAAGMISERRARWRTSSSWCRREIDGPCAWCSTRGRPGRSLANSSFRERLLIRACRPRRLIRRWKSRWRRKSGRSPSSE